MMAAFGETRPIEPFEFFRPQRNRVKGKQPKYVTRHFNKKYIASYQEGYLRFGTLYSYAKDDGIVSRLSDRSEGRHQEGYNYNKGNLHDITTRNGTRLGITVAGFDIDVLLTTTVNDYCACFSQGIFCPKRAEAMRAKGDDDISAYVTYDLAKLKYAINHESEIQNILFGDDTVIFGRLVNYGSKVEFFQSRVGESIGSGAPPLQRWLRAGLTKPRRFDVEDEFRILAFSAGLAGGLTTDSETVVIESNDKIAASIVDSGYIKEGRA